MRKILLLGLLLFLSSQVLARQALPPLWVEEAYKVDNPNELMVWVDVGEKCPFTTDELRDEISSSLIEYDAPIKPLMREEDFQQGVLFLSTQIDCLDEQLSEHPDKQVFIMLIKFVKFDEFPVMYARDYGGGWHIGDKDHMISSALDGFHEALKEFYFANREWYWKLTRQANHNRRIASRYFLETNNNHFFAVSVVVRQLRIGGYQYPNSGITQTANKYNTLVTTITLYGAGYRNR